MSEKASEVIETPAELVLYLGSSAFTSRCRQISINSVKKSILVWALAFYRTDS